MNLFKRVLCSVVIVFWVLSCGPSIRRTYQSDNAFSRCFDLDYNPAASVAAKEQCWSTWKKKYIYNQPDDKHRYADLRQKELAKGISEPGPPGPPGAFNKRPTEKQDGGPMPKPDKPAEVVVSPDAKKSPSQQPEDIPQIQCEHTCKDALQSCKQTCQSDAGITPLPCQNACNAGYRACMKNCFL